MKNLVMINKNVVDEIIEMVTDHYGYFDEWTTSDVVFIIQFALGMTERLYKPCEYMYDIFAELGIVEGHVHDKELVKIINDTEEEIGYYDEWTAVSILNAIEKHLDK